jgi:hypothetical protein
MSTKLDLQILICMNLLLLDCYFQDFSALADKIDLLSKRRVCIISDDEKSSNKHQWHLADNKVDTQTDRQTDRQTARQAGRRTDRKAYNNCT